MSTATEEPPKDQQTQIQPTPEARKADALSFLRPKVQVDGLTTQAPEPVKPPVKTEEKPPTKTDEKPPTDPKEQSIQELRKSRDEERKQREELQKQFETKNETLNKLMAEFEEHKKKPASEDFLKKHQELEAERNRLDQELRAAALERSPSFRKEYNDRINMNASSMVDIMVASGVEQKDAVNAVNTWNEDRFAEFAENMTLVQKTKFQAAWMQAEQIENERKAALANADAEWKKRESATQEQQKAQMEQHQKFLQSEEETMFKELFATEGLKENTELQQKARDAVQASYQMQPRQLMHAVATSRILADAVLAKDAEIAEMKKKLEEQAEFIKSAKEGVARVSPTDSAEKPEDKKARAQSFLNPKVVAQ